MRIAIVGAGVVGMATGLGLARFGHQVSWGDNSPKALERVAGAGRTWHFGVEPPPVGDLYLVCVPESAVPEVIYALAPAVGGRREGELVIRSTVLPGTTQALSAELGRPVFHNPEFLREATALEDFLHSRVAILGRPEGYSGGGTALEQAYDMMGARVVWTSSTVSEMVKVVVNNYLATLISYWNQVHLLCEKMGISSHYVARLAALDPRVVPYGAYRHGEPYSGRCLPKEITRMIPFYREKGVEPVLLEAVKAINDMVGKVNPPAADAQSTVSAEDGSPATHPHRWRSRGPSISPWDGESWKGS